MSYSKSSNIPIELLNGIGPRTAKVLKSLDIYTVAQFKRVPEKILIELFGPSILPIHRRVNNKRVTIKKRASAPSKNSFFKKIQLATSFVSFL
ncbi:hypothetical protein KKC88_00915 [Patescibacteria group bacterium]|nr:hypothetical protein [Patescibacteria group bacterium]MBU1673320.1 hypothetical protein [Patescibacteria group bacterium]MBU1963561.1 hypothetical protein [Patescibacteria group bacterium]